MTSRRGFDPYWDPITTEDVMKTATVIVESLEPLDVEDISDFGILVALAATAQLGDFDLFTKVVNKLGNVDWNRMSVDRHPLSIGMEYGQHEFVQRCINLPANELVAHHALIWAVVKSPPFIPSILGKFTQINEDLIYPVQLAFRKHTWAMEFFDPLIRNDEFLAIVQEHNDIDLLNYIQQKRGGVKRPGSPLFSPM